MIDPVDTEREPRDEIAETRIFPNPVVPIGTGTTSVNPGIIPGIALGTDPEDVEGRGSDETDEVWHYHTQAEVGAQNDFGAEENETPPPAADLAQQESAARSTEPI